MNCPFCDANEPRLISLYGSQLLLSQYRCRACGTYFEGLREDHEANTADRPAPSHAEEPTQSSAPAHERKTVDSPTPAREEASMHTSVPAREEGSAERVGTPREEETTPTSVAAREAPRPSRESASLQRSFSSSWEPKPRSQETL